MQFLQAFKFQFQNADWFKKIIIPALILLIPIVGQLYFLGWVMDITRRRLQEQPDSELLPGTQFGEFIKLGFQSFLVGLVYAIPIIVLVLPITIVSLAVDPNTDAGMTAVIAVSLCFGVVISLYSVFYAFILPAAMGNFLAKGAVRDGLRVKEAFSLLKKAPVAYLLVILGTILAGIIAPLGSIACGVGAMLTTTYAQSAVGHLIGQAYLKATA